MVELMATFDAVLAAEPPSAAASTDWDELAGRVKGNRAAMIGSAQGYIDSTTLLDLECSHGAISATDLKDLVPMVKAVTGRGLALLAIYDQHSRHQVVRP